MAPLTNDEILAKLSDRMRDTQEGDSWRVKVYRRRIGTAYPLPQHIATFDGSTLEMVANAEMWLPVLAGGGPLFELECYHTSNLTQFAGAGRLRFTVQGEERPITRDVVKSGNWHGPPTIIYPLPVEEREQGSVYSVSPPPAPSGISVVPPGATSTPYPGTVVTSPTAAPGAVTTTVTQPSAPSAEVQRMMEQFQAMKAQMEEKARREEIAAIERQHRLELSELRSRMEAQAQSQSVRPAEKPVTEVVTSVLAAAAPIITMLMESSARARQEQQASLAAMNQQNQLLMAKLLERPSIDPVIQSILDKASQPKDEMMPMVEAFSRMTRMSTQSIATAAELVARSNGQEEHPAMAIVREVRGAVEAITEGMKASRIQPPQQRQAALPAPPPPAPGMPAYNGTPAPAVLSDAAPQSVLGRIENSVRKHEDHITVGNVLLDAIASGEDSVSKGMEAAGGNIISLFQQRLGDSWLVADKANGDYIGKLARYLNEEAEKRGMLAAPEGDEGQQPQATA